MSGGGVGRDKKQKKVAEKKDKEKKHKAPLKGSELDGRSVTSCVPVVSDVW